MQDDISDLVNKYGSGGASAPTAPITNQPTNNDISDLISKYGTKSDTSTFEGRVASDKNKIDALKADHRYNNDTLSQAKDPKNELSWADQAVVFGTAFGTAMMDRMEKMGSAAGRLASAATGLDNPGDKTDSKGLTLFGHDFGKSNSDVAQFFRAFQNVGDNNSVRASTTGALKENLKKATEGRLSSVFGLDARNVGDFFGDVAPTMVVPGGAAESVLGKIGMGAVQGGVSGAIYGASESTSNDPADIGKAAAYGGGLGAVLGGGGGAVGAAVSGISKYVTNKFVPAKDADVAVTDLLDTIGKKSATIQQDASKTAAQIINDVKSQDADVITNLYAKAYDQPISSGQMAQIKSNPGLDQTLERYHDKLMTSKSTVNSEIAQNFQNMVERNAKTNTPSTYEYYDTIKKAMDDDIQASLNAGANQNASMLIEKQKQLLTILDSESGDYAMARGLSAQKKVVEDVFKDIGVEKMGQGNTAAYKKLATTILDTKMPINNLETLRDAFVEKDPKVWNSIVRTVFENKINLVENEGNPKPMEFIEALMRDKAKRNLVYTALDYPGNELTKAKLEALGQIYQDTFKTSITDNITHAAARSMATLRSMEGSKANEFDKLATQFIFDSKYNTAMNNIMSRPGLARDQKLDEIIKLILPTSQSNFSKATNKIIGAKTGELVGSRYTNEDKKN